MGLLEINNLHLDVESRHPHRSTRVLDGVSLSVESGRALCLVGESGSGKSVTALSIARLLPPAIARYPRGSIHLNGQSILDATEAQLQRLRGGTVSYVFQDPAAALNPVLQIRTQLLETLRLHQPTHATNHEVLNLLSQVGIPDAAARARAYPHELSGGMQQRITIALALASKPKLLVADEPTTALDVTLQAQILDLLNQLKRDTGMAILLITHNLGLVADLADDVAVLYAGQVVEYAPTLDLLSHPNHPYTRALLQSVPRIGHSHSRLQAIPGLVPIPGRWPEGCRFHPRCPIAQTSCHDRPPALTQPPGSTHACRCPLTEVAP